MRMRYVLGAGLLMGIFGVSSLAQKAGGGAHMIMMTEANMKWVDGPDSLPPGAKMAVMEGDPTRPGEHYTFRLKVPANYKIPPHWHPVDEHVTVLSGSVMLGNGDKIDPATATTLTVGGFGTLPAKMHHFAVYPTETVVQLHGVGPYTINYINPADDPRHKKK